MKLCIWIPLDRNRFDFGSISSSPAFAREQLRIVQRLKSRRHCHVVKIMTIIR